MKTVLLAALLATTVAVPSLSAAEYARSTKAGRTHYAQKQVHIEKEADGNWAATFWKNNLINSN